MVLQKFLSFSKRLLSMNFPNYLTMKTTNDYGANDIWWSTVAAALNQMSLGPRHFIYMAQCFKSSNYLPSIYFFGSIFILYRYYLSSLRPSAKTQIFSGKCESRYPTPLTSTERSFISGMGRLSLRKPTFQTLLGYSKSLAYLQKGMHSVQCFIRQAAQQICLIFKSTVPLVLSYSSVPFDLTEIVHLLSISITFHPQSELLESLISCVPNIKAFFIDSYSILKSLGYCLSLLSALKLNPAFMSISQSLRKMSKIFSQKRCHNRIALPQSLNCRIIQSINLGVEDECFSIIVYVKIIIYNCMIIRGFRLHHRPHSY